MFWRFKASGLSLHATIQYSPMDVNCDYLINNAISYTDCICIPSVAYSVCGCYENFHHKYVRVRVVNKDVSYLT